MHLVKNIMEVILKFKSFFIFSSLIVISACGGGNNTPSSTVASSSQPVISSSSSSAQSSLAAKKGTFIDSQVSGLEYQTAVMPALQMQMVALNMTKMESLLVFQLAENS